VKLGEWCGDVQAFVGDFACSNCRFDVLEQGPFVIADADNRSTVFPGMDARQADCSFAIDDAGEIPHIDIGQFVD